MIEPWRAILDSRQHHTERLNTTAAAVGLVIGSLPDVCDWLVRTGETDPLFARRVFAGVDVLHRSTSPCIDDSLPEPQRAAVLEAVHTICVVLADWATGFYGDKPIDDDLVEFQEVMEWATRGALFGQFQYNRLNFVDPFLAWRTPYKLKPSLREQALGYMFEEV